MPVRTELIAAFFITSIALVACRQNADMAERDSILFAQRDSILKADLNAHSIVGTVIAARQDRITVEKSTAQASPNVSRWPLRSAGATTFTFLLDTSTNIIDATQVPPKSVRIADIRLGDQVRAWPSDVSVQTQPIQVEASEVLIELRSSKP